MPADPYSSIMAQPGQPKKEVSPNPYANITQGPPGVASGPGGRPAAPAQPGPSAGPGPSAQVTAPVAPSAPRPAPQQPAAQPSGQGVTIQIGQPQQPQQQPAVAPQGPPEIPAPTKPGDPMFVDPKTGQRTAAATPEQRVEYGRQMAAARQKFGQTPFSGDPNAPQPDIQLGKPNYNPFAPPGMQWS